MSTRENRPPRYLCNPKLNAACMKTGCGFYGRGPCTATLHPAFAERDYFGNPILYDEMNISSVTRLLTYEEAMSAVGHGWEEVWFEADPDEGEAEYKECFECVFIYGHILCADGDIGEVDIDRYNRPYHSRLWLGEERPTDEQRAAAPWEGDEEECSKN